MCENCKNLEICRYASMMKDAEREVKKIDCISEVFKIEIKCKYFVNKDSFTFPGVITDPGVRFL